MPELIVAVRQDGNGIILSWQGLTTPGIEKLHIYRRTGDETPVKLTTKPNADGSWTDNKTTPGTSYIYTVHAEYNYGDVIMVNDGVLVRRIR